MWSEIIFIHIGAASPAIGLVLKNSSRQVAKAQRKSMQVASQVAHAPHTCHLQPSPCIFA